MLESLVVSIRNLALCCISLRIRYRALVLLANSDHLGTRHLATRIVADFVIFELLIFPY